MFVRSGKLLMVCALIISIGGHWAVLQSAAWMGMAVGYAQSSSVSEALSKTFDGKHPCKLCKVVSKGKETQKKSESKLDAKKLDSFFASNTGFYFPPLKQSPSSRVESLSSRINVPLSPPPRFA